MLRWYRKGLFEGAITAVFLKPVRTFIHKYQYPGSRFKFIYITSVPEITFIHRYTYPEHAYPGFDYKYVKTALSYIHEYYWPGARFNFIKISKGRPKVRLFIQNVGRMGLR